MTSVQSDRAAREALSAFSGPFEVEAAEYVLSRSLAISESQALAQLAGLVEAGVLSRTFHEGRTNLEHTSGSSALAHDATDTLRDAATHFHALYYLAVGPERRGDTWWTRVLLEEVENFRAAMWRAADEPTIAAAATLALGDRGSLGHALGDSSRQSDWARSVRWQLANGDKQLLLEAHLNECVVLYHAGSIEESRATLEELLETCATEPQSEIIRLRLLHTQLACDYKARDALRAIAMRPRELLSKRRGVVTQALFEAARTAVRIADDPSTALSLLDELQRRSDRSTALLRDVEITRVNALIELGLYGEATSFCAMAFTNSRLPEQHRTWLRALRSGIELLTQDTSQSRDLSIDFAGEPTLAAWLEFLRVCLSKPFPGDRCKALLELAEFSRRHGLSELEGYATAAAAVLSGVPYPDRGSDPTGSVLLRWCAAVARAAADKPRLALLYAVAHTPVGLDARGEPHRTSLYDRSVAVRILCRLGEASVDAQPALALGAPEDMEGPPARALRCLRLAAALEPGTPVSIETICAWAWNEPLPDAESMANRVRVLIARLRKQGWRDQLSSEKGGYLYDAR